MQYHRGQWHISYMYYELKSWRGIPGVCTGLFNPMLQLRGGVCTGFVKPHATVKRGDRANVRGVIQAQWLNEHKKINLLYNVLQYTAQVVYIYFIIVACPAGSYGKNCSDVCPYPYYGILCEGMCNCSKERFKYLCNIQ